MASSQQALQHLSKQNGFVAAAIGHGESGMMLDSISNGGDFNIEMAIAMNCEVVRAKLKAMHSLDLDTHIEDILITLGTQYHLIRPHHENPIVFMYLALERESSNLAMARMALEKAEKAFEL
jgi:hypothetical protein